MVKEVASSQLPIAIIGGGLAGICLSIGLIKYGIPHKIYESAKGFGEVGYGVAMAPNAQAALKAINPRLAECLERCVTRNSYPDKKGNWLTFRHAMADKFGENILEISATGKTEQGFGSVHRAKFLSEVLKSIPELTAEFGKHLVNLEELEDSVRLEFADGTVDYASAVIACDGIKSTIRKYVAKDSDIDFAYEYAYRRLIPMAEAKEVLGEEMAMNSSVLCGYDTYATMYPVEHYEYFNLICIVRTKELIKDRTSCTLDDMLKDLGGYGEPIIRLMKKNKQPERWPCFDLLPLKKYDYGRILLIGDAAHASTPHQGSGAGMAFEDAALLSYMLKDGFDLRAFELFDHMRRERTQRLCQTSREAGLVYEFVREGLMDDIDKIRENLKVRHTWIWEYDIEGERRKFDKLIGKTANI